MSEIAEKTIYVSLSIKDHQCIMDDIMIFRCNPKDKNGRYRFSYQQFLKRIFLNIHDKTDFVKLEQNRIHRKKASKNQNDYSPIKINNAITTKIFEKIERLYQEKLLGSVFDKADMECIKNNGLTPNILRGANYAQIFVLCIEYYCSLSMPEREAIIYHQPLEKLREHIKNHEIITILKNKPVLDTKSANYKDESKITVLPYKIGVTKESNRHYLACFLMKQEENEWYFRNLESVPVKNIIPYYYDNNKEWFRVHQKIKPDRDIHFREPKKEGGKFCSSYSEMIGYMESRLALDGYEYLPGSAEQVKVELTPKGFERLYDWANFRPKFTADEDKGFITFEATFMQTFRYFFKFGKEARITSPQKYIDDFKTALRKLSDIYEKDNDSSQDQND